ncbi:Uncharacterised protein [Vibrio cholerae]|nr:Uncharacterised protein [Vibrio cholerae]
MTCSVLACCCCTDFLLLSAEEASCVTVEAIVFALSITSPTMWLRD